MTPVNQIPPVPAVAVTDLPQQNAEVTDSQAKSKTAEVAAEHFQEAIGGGGGAAPTEEAQDAPASKKPGASITIPKTPEDAKDEIITFNLDIDEEDYEVSFKIDMKALFRHVHFGDQAPNPMVITQMKSYSEYFVYKPMPDQVDDLRFSLQLTKVEGDKCCFELNYFNFETNREIEYALKTPGPDDEGEGVTIIKGNINGRRCYLEVEIDRIYHEECSGGYSEDWDQYEVLLEPIIIDDEGNELTEYSGMFTLQETQKTPMVPTTSFQIVSKQKDGPHLFCTDYLDSEVE